MFKTNRCEYCIDMIKILKNLATHDLRITWAVADVGVYKNIISMAKDSSTPLKGVPTCIFYVNNRPHINYRGKRTIKNIQDFISKALEKIGPSVASRFVPQEDCHVAPSKFPKSVRSPPHQQAPQSSQGQQPKEGVNIPSKVTPHNAPYLAYGKSAA